MLFFYYRGTVDSDFKENSKRIVSFFLFKVFKQTFGLRLVIKKSKRIKVIHGVIFNYKKNY